MKLVQIREHRLDADARWLGLTNAYAQLLLGSASPDGMFDRPRPIYRLGIGWDKDLPLRPWPKAHTQVRSTQPVHTPEGEAIQPMYLDWCLAWFGLYIGLSVPFHIRFHVELYTEEEADDEEPTWH
jgi:hypothetical protein